VWGAANQSLTQQRGTNLWLWGASARAPTTTMTHDGVKLVREGGSAHVCDTVMRESESVRSQGWKEKWKTKVRAGSLTKTQIQYLKLHI